MVACSPILHQHLQLQLRQEERLLLQLQHLALLPSSHWILLYSSEPDIYKARNKLRIRVAYLLVLAVGSNQTKPGGARQRDRAQRDHTQKTSGNTIPLDGTTDDSVAPWRMVERKPPSLPSFLARIGPTECLCC